MSFLQLKHILYGGNNEQSTIWTKSGAATYNRQYLQSEMMGLLQLHFSGFSSFKEHSILLYNFDYCILEKALSKSACIAGNYKLYAGLKV